MISYVKVAVPIEDPMIMFIRFCWRYKIKGVHWEVQKDLLCCLSLHCTKETAVESEND